MCLLDAPQAYAIRLQASLQHCVHIAFAFSSSSAASEVYQNLPHRLKASLSNIKLLSMALAKK